MNANKKISADSLAIITALLESKGRHVSVTWKREMETYKEVTKKVEKRTRAWVRTGIDYKNLASVKQGIASGERDEVQPLPSWQEWGEFPYILRHKTQGTEYVRLFPATFANLVPTVEYFIDGVPATKAEIEPLVTAKEKRERDEPAAVFNVKVNSILAIG